MALGWRSCGLLSGTLRSGRRAAPAGPTSSSGTASKPPRQQHGRASITAPPLGRSRRTAAGPITVVLAVTDAHRPPVIAAAAPRTTDDPGAITGSRYR